MTRENKKVAIKKLEEWLTAEGRAVANNSPITHKGEKKGQEHKGRVTTTIYEAKQQVNKPHDHNTRL